MTTCPVEYRFGRAIGFCHAFYFSSEKMKSQALMRNTQECVGGKTFLSQAPSWCRRTLLRDFYDNKKSSNFDISGDMERDGEKYQVQDENMKMT